jgi:membrane protease YdiL (CAAX protease family)
MNLSGGPGTEAGDNQTKCYNHSSFHETTPMHYKEAVKTTGLIILSLAVILLLYFGIELVTDYFYDEDLVVPAIISNASLAVVIYFLVRLFNKKVNGLSPSDYEFGSKHLVKNFLIGIFIAASILFLIFLSAYIISGNRPDFIRLKDGYPLLLIEFLMIHLVVGVWEEMYFRGLVVNTLLRRNVSFTATAILSSALFTGLHVFSFDLVTITPFWVIIVFLLSVVLLYTYILTRSIWAPIGLHFFWDFFITSLEKNENEFGMIEMKTYEQDMLLIDNITLVVAVVVVILFFILMRKRIRVAVQRYCEVVRGPVPRSPDS